MQPGQIAVQHDDVVVADQGPLQPARTIQCDVDGHLGAPQPGRHGAGPSPGRPRSPAPASSSPSAARIQAISRYPSPADTVPKPSLAYDGSNRHLPERDLAVIVDRPPRGSAAAEGAGRPWRWLAAAAAAFAALCIVALTTAPQLVEPDDHAYQASIIAATQGHWLTLSTAQVHALGTQFAQVGPQRGRPAARGGPPALIQWVQLPGGRWISEKDPGYPFLAAPFQWLGLIRLAPLFYGALGCLGLFVGARRWLGRHRRRRGRRLVLLVGRGVGLRVARLHADLHRCLADRGGHRGPAVGPAGRRGRRAPAHRDRAARLPGPGGRRVRPLHRPRRAGLRRRGRPGRPAAAAACPPPGSGVVARLGRGVRRGRGHLR